MTAVKDLQQVEQRTSRHRREDPGPLLVPGTVAAAYLLATGRWGSYVGWPAHQVYAGDVLLALTVVWALLRHRASFSATRRDLVALAPVLALAGWAAVRLVTPLHLESDALRDVAPYLYLLVACFGLVRVGERARLRTTAVLYAALVVHAGWFVWSMRFPARVAGLPLLDGTVRVLETRADFDGSVTAVLASASLALAVGSRRLPARLALLALSVASMYVVASTANRAALIALVTTLCGVLVACWSTLALAVRHHPRVSAAAAVLLLVALVVVAPRTPVYDRLAGGAGWAKNSVSGTTAAREAAWGEVLHYVDHRPSRVAVGVGMGPDFLQDSGAAVHFQYVGRKEVRQPHNYALNTYARTGLVGVALLAWLLVSLVVAAVRALRRKEATHLGVLCALVLGALFVASMVGVILESPFAAIPFAFAAGRVLVPPSDEAGDAGRAA
ncbi:O-antigen ligase [Motilibacter rhizosphaerae]|uniref:O-antigen ligase n=1 Tax=Motilibacter rhizosphaerae TaxID=598652 RepID=A0A4Q7NVL3_9ACTN|nr:O-antigen ligase family protein [Motilibacter rhizosphaerae]RZS91291.1 O-antigen ligase [Motilibacter rhizosphaerae]